MSNDKKIDFEKSLYGDVTTDIAREIIDVEFWADRIVCLPSFRPFNLETTVRLSIEYCKNTQFRHKLLEKALVCPVLIYRLFKSGVYVLNDVTDILNRRDSLVFCYYFWKEIQKFPEFIRKKRNDGCIDGDFCGNEEEYDLYIEYGFVPFSMEYCLKYDEIVKFRDIDTQNRQFAKWSPFEWSYKPSSLDLLSFSGYFGSIQCFKYLLMKGYPIIDEVRSLVIFSGNIDLFHISNRTESINFEIFNASEYNRLSFLEYLVENGANLNENDQNFVT